jgi:hypothetical protein
MGGSDDWRFLSSVSPTVGFRSGFYVRTVVWMVGMDGRTENQYSTHSTEINDVLFCLRVLCKTSRVINHRHPDCIVSLHSSTVESSSASVPKSQVRYEGFTVPIS